jgi:GTP-binding protein
LVTFNGGASGAAVLAYAEISGADKAATQSNWAINFIGVLFLLSKTGPFYNAAPGFQLKHMTTNTNPAVLPPADATPNETAKSPAVVALGWLHTAKFLTTAPQLHFLPALDVPEIAFVGRSNAGKSTCINTLTQQKQLAFASKKPGRTQHINLFSLGKQGITDAVLTDLPGYGYAAVPKADKIRWQQVMANYLVTRENLMGIVLMCDPRHGLTELDEILLDIIRPRVQEGLKFLIILTKSDKLTRAEAAKILSITKLQAGGGEVMLFSATKRKGIDEVAQLLWKWAHPKGNAVETEAS